MKTEENLNKKIDATLEDSKEGSSITLKLNSADEEVVPSMKWSEDPFGERLMQTQYNTDQKINPEYKPPRQAPKVRKDHLCC